MHHRIQPECRPAGRSCPPRAESLCAQGRQGAAGRSGQGRMQMAHAAVEALGRVDGGVVVTKYEHVRGEILGVNCYEAGGGQLRPAGRHSGWMR